MKKIGRNDSCPCGSGKKYKQCCQQHEDVLPATKKDAVPAPPLPSIQTALEHHQAGRLQQAEVIYRHILQAAPNHPDALHLLGMIAHQTGKHDSAVELIGKAIQAHPSSSMHCNLGNILQSQGKFDAAVAHYHQALALNPDFTEAHYNLGNALQAQGLLDTATASYRQALLLTPGHVGTHYNLGLVLQAQGQLDAALAHYRQVLALKPDFAEAQNNLGLVLQTQGRLDAAVEHYEKALSFKPDFAEAQNNLGNALQAQGRLDAAVEHYEQALALKPDFAEAHYNLGNVLQAQGRLDAAIKCYRQALLRKPEYADAHHNLGNALQEQSEFAAAVECYQRVLALKPEYADAHYNLGNVLQAQGQLDAAIDCYQRGLALKLEYADAHHNLGNAFKTQGKLEAAVACYRQALAIDPNHAEAYNNLGNAFKEQGKLDQAVTCCQKALALKPDYVEAHRNLGMVLQNQGKLGEARVCFERAISINPDYVEAHNCLAITLQSQGKLDEAITCYQHAIALDPEDTKLQHNLLFCYNYHPTLSAEDIFAAYRRWNAQHAAALSLDVPPLPHLREPQLRLKIGYVSPDFCNHSVIHFAAPLIERHDKARFEVFCYYNNTLHDAFTDRIIAAVDHWIPCAHLSDAQLTQRIRADGIDLLIDLAGHTAGNRLLVFARKPAPVQTSWLGYGYTTGLTAIDYFIGDAVFTPPGSESLFSESLYRLPHASWTYQPPDAPEPGELPAQQRGHVTFACLSRSERINARMIEAWAVILRRLPDARLRFDSRNFTDAGLCSSIAAQFAALGVPSTQLELGFTSPVWAVYQNVDIVLDCFPHNSGTTTFEALWMGVPVVTLADRPSVGRLGASILSCIGKPEWIATDVDDYINRAVALAQDVPRLVQERTTLRQTMLDSPLMDQAGFVRDMEAAYRDMWHRWCKNLQEQKESV